MSEVDAYATTRGSVNNENSNEVLQEQTHEMCDCEAYHAKALIENKTNTLCNYANGVRFFFARNYFGIVFEHTPPFRHLS